MKTFFFKSSHLDLLALKPLSHIKPYWDLSWDSELEEYLVEEGSFALELNNLISEIENTPPPSKYHVCEDELANYVKANLNWPITKINNRWVFLKNISDYPSILEQGGFGDIDEKNLILSASGRIQAAIDFGQNHFDEMEDGHQRILAIVLAIILFQRDCRT